MITPEIENLIVKYLSKSATAIDLDTLSEWIKHPKNRNVFKDYVQTHYAITYTMNEPDSKKALERLLRTIRKEKSMVYQLKNQPIFKYAAAAVLIIALASTYFLRETIFTNQPSTSNQPVIVNNQIEPGIDKATLTLEDGTTVAIEKGTSIQTQNATSNGEEIIYTNSSSRNLVYNYLTIPRGGEFQITLSDGTKVWLNSETQLKYPVSFTDGESRQVELVYGEAYFEVSHSSEHKGSDFKVNNQNQVIQVLGTNFNVKAYKDESKIYSTLVSGKVAISTESTNQVLTPNQQATLDLTTDNLSIKNIDIKGEISWINGEFIVKNKSLKEIMKVLSRWYDMDVTFADIELENVRFVGVLGKDQDIVSILNTIQSFGVIKNYEIKNKNVILK
ncbi:FecR family protein [Gelidibacter sp. F63206]|uniref:FecR family protein n=1 Tax=Gelidibacter sp. F63206 TaxID=2926425 RepID=UPI001FF3EF94|nr:FecR domain-containing protein [Gelidibacter sp. F63206]MCK0114821.1 FecR domain-containing protein [Gelidibacter sp. F63206]